MFKLSLTYLMANLQKKNVNQCVPVTLVKHKKSKFLLKNYVIIT